MANEELDRARAVEAYNRSGGLKPGSWNDALHHLDSLELLAYIQCAAKLAREGWSPEA